LPYLLSFQTRARAVAIMATIIAGAKENSGVVGAAVELFVEFGLGDTLIVGVDEVAVVADGELVGAWVTAAEGDGDEEWWEFGLLLASL
jgi:hypothetical protein